VVIGPESMHYSFTKAAGLLGLGEQGLVRIPTDVRGRIDVPALRATVAACQERGACILALVGVAGSTDAGALDPLADLAEVARAAQVHFHVDAAWGGPFLFSPKHRERLAGIEQADSVTFDGHKQLYLPLGIGLLLLRDPHAARAIEKQAHYLSRPGSADLGRRSLEGSRPGTALFLHAGLHVFGRAGYAALVEESIRKASWLADRIKDLPDFELLADPDSNLVLYRYVPAAWRNRLLEGDLTAADHEALNRFNERLHKAQRRAGRAYVSRTTLYRTSPNIGYVKAVGVGEVVLVALVVMGVALAHGRPLGLPWWKVAGIGLCVVGAVLVALEETKSSPTPRLTVAAAGETGADPEPRASGGDDMCLQWCQRPDRPTEVPVPTPLHRGALRDGQEKTTARRHGPATAPVTVRGACPATKDSASTETFTPGRLP
jgi:Pyridoxal-dependent decarboxylase conserved domain